MHLSICGLAFSALMIPWYYQPVNEESRRSYERFSKTLKEAVEHNS